MLPIEVQQSARQAVAMVQPQRVGADTGAWQHPAGQPVESARILAPGHSPGE